MDLQLRTMQPGDSEAVSALADVLVGSGYYPPSLVDEYRIRSTDGDHVQSWVAVDGEEIVAFRFTFPPGRWSEGRGKGLSPEDWPVGLEKAAYFQSCFVSESYMGHGIGRRLAAASLEALRAHGTGMVVAHCWKESPHNSSFRYLTRLGFQPVTEHPLYWVDVDYVCKLDGQPCRCTAIEMILDLRTDGMA